MRILIFSNLYKPTISGVVTSITLFRRGLVDAGHDVHIIAPEYEDYQDEEPYVFRCPSLDLPERVDVSLPIPLKTTMSPTVRGIKPSLIHSQHPFVMGGLATAFARDLNLPLVFTLHSPYDVYARQFVPIVPKLAGVLTEEIVKRYLGKCTHIIVPAPRLRDFVVSEYQVDVPVSVVPTPVDLSMYRGLEPGRIRAELGLEGAELLLYVGRFSEEKNIEFLLRSFAQIVAQRPQARLLLVGKGMYERSLRRLVDKLDLGERVIFDGPVAYDDIPHYAAAADLFVFSSLVDTQGVVMIEAMATGTPVVALKSPGSTDTLAEGGGVIVPAQEDAFASTVLALLADGPRRRAMGEQAVQAVQRYKISSVTARMIDVYEEAIAAGPRLTKKELKRLRDQKNAAETWREVSNQIRSVGESLSAAFSTVWEGDGEDMRSRLQAMRVNLEAIIEEIDREIRTGIK